MRAPIDRLLARVEKTPSCWLWTGSVGSHGYGQLYIKRADGKQGMALTHRLAYESLVGPIPDGLQIDHLCRVKRCVNPEHLEPVTQRVNILRSESPAAVAARATHCIRGHEFTPENTRIRNGNHRECRACGRARWAEREHSPEERAAAAARARAWYRANKKKSESAA